MTPPGPGARSAGRRATVAFVVSALASLGFGAVEWTGGQVQLEGVLLGLGLAGLCVGIVAWANDVLPREQVTGDREPLPSSPEEVEALEADLDGSAFSRRSLLAAAGVSAAALGAALSFPIRSLGPNPGRSLQQTPWARGRRLISDDGRLIRVEDVPLDGLVTVFPEGFAGSADGQAVLIRVRRELLRPRRGREGWSPEGVVAYSKLCTHAGCPVGLYQAEAHQLLCPCHQSTFDVLDGARPVFGPAAVSLPQLPLTIAPGGYLAATGDFSGPVGPASWSGDR